MGESNVKLVGRYIIGGMIGFVMGIIGNLIATWIQIDLLKNKFWPNGIIFILLFTVIGIVVGSILEFNKARQEKNLHEVDLNDVETHFSFLRLRGKGIKAKKVYSDSSIIDIDTGDEKDGK